MKNKEKITLIEEDIQDLFLRLKSLEKEQTIIKNAIRINQITNLTTSVANSFKNMQNAFNNHANKFETFYDWYKLYPKSYNLFAEYNRNNANHEGDKIKTIWGGLNYILDYFDKKTDYDIEFITYLLKKNKYKITVYLDFKILFNFCFSTRKEAFLIGLKKLLEHYEKTLH